MREARHVFNHDGRTVTVENVTPELAHKYLSSMPNNRRVRHRVVKELVAAITTGEWFPTIEPIHFDIGGHLRNGQHRLTAIEQTGATLEMLVVRGATEDEIDAIDTGNRRIPGDVLSLRHGVADGDTTAAALKFLFNYEHGWMPAGSGRSMLNNHDMGVYFTEHPAIVKSVQYVNETPSLRKLGSKGTMAFCHYLITQATYRVDIDAGREDRGDKFFHCLEREIYDGNNDPIYRLRERLYRAKNSYGSGKERLTVADVAALIIKAWNMWVTGKTITRLAWRNYGDNPEPFPKPLSPK